MNKKCSIKNVNLSSVKALSKERIIVLCETEKDREIDSLYQHFIRKKDGKWSSLKCPKSSSVFGRNIQEMEIYIIGINGVIVRGDKTGWQMENIPEVEKIGAIRSATSINDEIYIVGMGQQVYKRISKNNFKKLTPQNQDISKIEVSGFNTIISDNNMDLFAAGFGGEIWKFSNESWSKEKSPTEYILETSLKLPNGDLIFCGQAGQIVIKKNNKNNFELIEQSLTTDTFWDVCLYKDKIFLATSTQIFEMNFKFELKENILTLDNKISTGHLSVADGMIWSSGGEFLYSSEDGCQWILEKIECNFE